MEKNKAIAVISFGTTYLDTAEKTIKAVENEVSSNFKDYNIVSAYTSSIVRNKLSSMGIEVLSPTECFQKLIENGFKDVIVLPTHVISGEEYSKVVDCSKKFASKFDTLKVCRPLIDIQDISHIVDTILDVFKLNDTQYLVFMGHGSPTQANKIYSLINAELNLRGIENIYISTVEAQPDLDKAICKVKEYNPKEVILTPFMLVSGDHANNDMAIDWKTEFENSGFITNCIMKGLGEYPEFRKIYIERVQELL